ncbi:MAG: DUF2278 family protein [Nitrospira sp.]|nr:DUF2278 family protein [Nitrospira sp.]
MPVQNYGVLLGTKAGYHRDLPDNFGRFYHGHIDVQTPGQLFNTAIDVDTNRQGVQVRWRILQLRVTEWDSIFTLSDGFHALPSSETSGATDYVRDARLRHLMFIPEFIEQVPWWRRLWERIRLVTNPIQEIAQRPILQFLSRRYRVVDLTPPWKTGTGMEALTDLESMIIDAARVVIFGAFYPARNSQPPGLHDIHLNQGDPVGSPFAALDGIWQDGLTIVIHSDGTASAFMNMFSTQTLNTDSQGHPIP